MATHEIDWGKCIQVCSDGANAMTGKVNGTVERIKNVAKSCNSTNCILHRYALVTKRISVTFKSVLEEAVKIINFIKSKPLQSRIFKTILSRGKILCKYFKCERNCWRILLLMYFSFQTD